MTLDELLLALPFNYDYFVRLAEFYVANADEVTVSFTGTPLTAVAPGVVTFTSTVGGDVTKYHWSFGDGETSTEANPAHTYATAGVYSVTCIVEDSIGSQAVQAREDYITITSV